MSISEERVNKALAYLVESADKAAGARAERLYLEEFTKHLKARMMTEGAMEGMSLGAQERQACASNAYRTHLEGLRAAIEADEQYRYRREAESALVEAYRTFSANTRVVR